MEAIDATPASPTELPSSQRPVAAASVTFLPLQPAADAIDAAPASPTELPSSQSVCSVLFRSGIVARSRPCAEPTTTPDRVRESVTKRSLELLHHACKFGLCLETHYRACIALGGQLV